MNERTRAKAERLKRMVQSKKLLNKQFQDMYNQYDNEVDFLGEVKQLFNQFIEKLNNKDGNGKVNNERTDTTRLQ